MRPAKWDGVAAKWLGEVAREKTREKTHKSGWFTADRSTATKASDPSAVREIVDLAQEKVAAAQKGAAAQKAAADAAMAVATAAAASAASAADPDAPTTTTTTAAAAASATMPQKPAAFKCKFPQKSIRPL